MGRWSRGLAPAFVAWVGVPEGARALDVGCGTGALSEALLARKPSSLLGVDLSAPFVEEARRRLAGLKARFEVAGAQDLPLPDGSVDAAASGLVLNFVPEPARMVREMRRVLAPGGMAAVYVWDYSGRMELMRRFWDAAVALDPQARALDEGHRFPDVCDPDALRRLFEEAGLREVETRAIDHPTRFRDFDDYWSPFLGGVGPAPAYCAALEPRAREALRERLKATLPIQADGSIPLVARAWAVKGRA